ncbi:MAG TPA: hypothetical protein PKX67_04260 [Anaerolineaceae bacterium]|nr:hypothetical protein [Anaerolineaceae bacterium]
MKENELETETREEYRERLALEAQALSPDRFEILAITAGAANGWEFPPEVLRQSLGLWEGVNCFVDHDWTSRSVRDIAGILRKVSWDEHAQGIRAELHAFGPSAELLTKVGRQVLEEKDEPAVRVGFSADILFNGKDHRVEKILKIFSVDLVYNPARGGMFLRALNQIGFSPKLKGDVLIQNLEDNPNETLTSQAELAEPTIESPQALQAQLAELRDMRKQMSAMVLDASLAQSSLPAPVSQRIRQQFQDRTFAPSELQAAIREARGMLADLNGGSAVQGPARIEGMLAPEERLQAAVDDLFDVPREKRLQNASAPRLSGIRELYLTLTGDYELHGGFYPQRTQLATTADFSGLVKNALNKLVTNTWEDLGRAGYDWWKDITVQEHFNSLHDITGTLIGTVGDLPAVAEGASYTELQVGDSPETASFTKYGGYIPLTLELIDRDETRKLRAYARELATAGMRKISKLVAQIFTANGGVGPTMADGGALFNATAVTTAGGHANLGTSALSADAWDQTCRKVYRQPMLIKNSAPLRGTGPMLAVNPKFILVPRALQKTALELCSGALVRESGYVYDNVLKGSAVPVVVPDWADDNDWAAACDPRVVPAIFVGERFGLMPEIFVAGDELSPAVFTNDEHRLKVRHYLAVWVNDYRPLFKNNVA